MSEGNGARPLGDGPLSGLRAVEFGWRQEALAENARDISDNAAELYKRLAKFG